MGSCCSLWLPMSSDGLCYPVVVTRGLPWLPVASHGPQWPPVVLMACNVLPRPWKPLRKGPVLQSGEGSYTKGFALCAAAPRVRPGAERPIVKRPSVKRPIAKHSSVKLAGWSAEWPIFVSWFPWANYLAVFWLASWTVVPSDGG